MTLLGDALDRTDAVLDRFDLSNGDGSLVLYQAKALQQTIGGPCGHYALSNAAHLVNCVRASTADGAGRMVADIGSRSAPPPPTAPGTAEPG